MNWYRQHVIFQLVSFQFLAVSLSLFFIIFGDNVTQFTCKVWDCVFAKEENERMSLTKKINMASIYFCFFLYMYFLLLSSRIRFKSSKCLTYAKQLLSSIKQFCSMQYFSVTRNNMLYCGCEVFRENNTTKLLLLNIFVSIKIADYIFCSLNHLIEYL